MYNVSFECASCVLCASFHGCVYQGEQGVEGKKNRRWGVGERYMAHPGVGKGNKIEEGKDE